jgi:hypothetical protein
MGSDARAMIVSDHLKSQHAWCSLPCARVWPCRQQERSILVRDTPEQSLYNRRCCMGPQQKTTWRLDLQWCVHTTSCVRAGAARVTGSVVVLSQVSVAGVSRTALAPSVERVRGQARRC